MAVLDSVLVTVDDTVEDAVVVIVVVETLDTVDDTEVVADVTLVLDIDVVADDVADLLALDEAVELKELDAVDNTDEVMLEVSEEEAVELTELLTDNDTVEVTLVDAVVKSHDLSVPSSYTWIDSLSRRANRLHLASSRDDS